MGTSARHRRRASSLVSRAPRLMISRRWRRIAVETAAVFVFRAGHSPITSTLKNCGDLHIRMSRDRDHNPTGATGWPGMSRNVKSFSSANGIEICSLLPPSHLIAVIRTRPLCTLMSTSSRPWIKVSRRPVARSPPDQRRDLSPKALEVSWIANGTFMPDKVTAILSSRSGPAWLQRVSHCACKSISGFRAGPNTSSGPRHSSSQHHPLNRVY